MRAAHDLGNIEGRGRSAGQNRAEKARLAALAQSRPRSVSTAHRPSLRVAEVNSKAASNAQFERVRRTNFYSALRGQRGSKNTLRQIVRA